VPLPRENKIAASSRRKPVFQDQFVSLNRFAMDFGAIVEMKASQRSALRLDAGTTFVRYLQGLDPRQPGVAVISPNYIATEGNFQLAMGYAYRF
jgi:hypothetical protein